MKNLIYFFITALLTVTSSATVTAASLPASSIDYTRHSGDRFLFVEGGIEFSVYPDGEFDFVLPELINNLRINVNSDPLNISYNSGFNYDAYVQYDSYGAVIQIADVPVFYDNWGRIVQAGNIAINYRDGRIARVGNLQVFYSGNAFSYTRGYINPYNRRVSYYPYANYFYRPYVDRCLVYTTPYRRFYTPQRFSYDYHRNHYRAGYTDGYANAYRNFNRPNGSIAHNNARSGSYRDARNATSRSSISSTGTNRRNADVGVSRSSRSIENTRTRGLSSVDRKEIQSRSSAVRSSTGSSRSSANAPSRNTTRTTPVDRKGTASRSSAVRSVTGRTESSTNRSSGSVPSRNTTANSSRSSRTTNQAARSSTRNTQRVAPTTRSRTQNKNNAPSARRSSQNSKSNKGAATTSRSSRSSSSRSSRSGGN